ncbi:Uncharacterised protein [Mycobacteroides abscessus]|nr:Uncharacterised protein [Mycobacteroides abscessus]
MRHRALASSTSAVRSANQSSGSLVRQGSRPARRRSNSAESFSPSGVASGWWGTQGPDPP